jgi:hypothetical protein
MNVAVKDRQRDIEYIRIALNCVEIGIDYQRADLINRTLVVLARNKGKFSLENATEIQAKWEKDWADYFDEKKKELETNE